MRNRILTRIIGLFMALMLLAAIILGFYLIKQKMSEGASDPEPSEQTESANTVDMLPHGPFRLYITTNKVSTQSYTSFAVYFVNDTSTELLFSCGRMFPSSQVQSITWSDENDDIIVTLTNGRQELFSYDGSGQWL